MVYVAARKSRNSETRMNRSMARRKSRHVLAVGINDQLRFAQLVLAASGHQADGTVVQRVAHPLRVPTVGQRNAEAVLGPEHVHGRAVDLAGPAPDMDDDAHPGQQAGQVDRHLVRDRPVEAGHTPAQAGWRRWGRP